MIEKFSIFLINWESLFIFETFIFSIISLILLSIITKNFLYYYNSENVIENNQKDKIIMKLKKEKLRLLNKIHQDENKRGDNILDIKDDWWSNSADVELSIKKLSELTINMRKKQGNYKLSDDANSIVCNFIKILKQLL